MRQWAGIPKQSMPMLGGNKARLPRAGHLVSFSDFL
jgi:hypothetical protein